MKFTDQEIANWKAYESVRASGAFNMFSRDALEASGLSRGDYFFTLKNYNELKSQAPDQPIT